MPQPNKIPRPFADSGDKNSIPDSSGGIGFASWQEGFPAITSEPFASGGVAPKRADFNGIFNALSLATLWQQQGGFYAYDSTTDYEVGNVVEYSNDLYKCITANGPSSAVKAPTDTTVWDAIATASGYLSLSGGTITGEVKAPTPATSDNSTKIATTAFVENHSSAVVSGTLTKTENVGSTYSWVICQNHVAFMRLSFAFVATPSAWTAYNVFTSSIKPASEHVGFSINQDGSQGSTYFTIDTSGNVALNFKGGSLPTNNWYHSAIIFPC